MCLVSFIPRPEGFILSSNRDELPERAAMILEEEEVGDDGITYPADIKGGSWIIMSKKLRIVCLLNGAFENHQRHLPYRMSRGVMMKEFFIHGSAVDFFEQFSFINIEPFTMIIIEEGCLFEFRWDGALKNVRTLDQHNVHIWSSSTLYDDAARQARSHLIKKLVSQADLSDHTSLQEIHMTKEDSENSLLIKREDGVQTISHTQVIKSHDSLIMKHYNLLKNTVQEIQY